jgi:type II secretory pathway pseudopilin PulG
MDGMTVLWIVVALAALVILVALIAGATRTSSKRRAERDRQQAYEHEQQARTSAARAEKQEAAADEVEARARKAQAIADEKAAEARRLAAGASERREAAAEARTEMDEHRTKAENLHPDESTPHAATWGKDHDETEDRWQGQDRDGSSREWDRESAWGRDGQPTDEHWADGRHPDDPRRQAPQSDQPDAHPKHSKH